MKINIYGITGVRIKNWNFQHLQPDLEKELIFILILDQDTCVSNMTKTGYLFYEDFDTKDQKAFRSECGKTSKVLTYSLKFQKDFSYLNF